MRLCNGGFGLIGFIVTIPMVLVLLLMLAIGFYEGRKAYWDSKILDMCEKDGGMRVHERVNLSKAEYNRLGGLAGMIPVPHERSALENYPFVSTGATLILNEDNPRVYRSETQYLRRNDKKVLATSIGYIRVGGDFPTYAHPSSFACPDQRKAVEEEKSIFSIEGFSK